MNDRKLALEKVLADRHSSSESINLSARWKSAPERPPLALSHDQQVVQEPQGRPGQNDI